ncbi:lipid II flippase MurJ, partial [Brachyspira hyodysenteriae]
MGEGRVSAVTFATRIHEFVLGVFAVSVATVMLPTLSKLIA